MITSHKTTYNVGLTSEEVDDIVNEIDLVYDHLVKENYTPEEIITLLTLKNALVAEVS